MNLLDGSTSLVAGSGSNQVSDNIDGTLAGFALPRGIALTPDGADLIVADKNGHRLRSVQAENVVNGECVGTSGLPEPEFNGIDTALAANVAVLYPVTTTFPSRVSELATGVWLGSTAGGARLGLYDDTGALLVDLPATFDGTRFRAAPAVRTAVFPTGSYFVGFVFASGTVSGPTHATPQSVISAAAAGGAFPASVSPGAATVTDTLFIQACMEFGLEPVVSVTTADAITVTFPAVGQNLQTLVMQVTNATDFSSFSAADPESYEVSVASPAAATTATVSGLTAETSYVQLSSCPQLVLLVPTWFRSDPMLVF